MSPSGLGVVASARVASGAWTPLNIPDCSLWLDAADLATLTLSGSNVTQWRDKSAQAILLPAVGTGAISGTRTLNGKNALDFLGTGGFFKTGGGTVSSLADGTWTMFVVATTDVVSGLRMVASSGAQAVGQYLRVNEQQTETIGWPGPVSDYIPGPTAAGATFLIRSLRTTTTLEAFFNGIGNGSVQLAIDPPTANAYLSVGSYENILCWDGLIAEVLMYSRGLNASEITAVEGYLNAKWRLPGAWANLFYDYWEQSEATASGWPSHKGLLPTLPVATNSIGWRTPSGGVRVAGSTHAGLLDSTVHTVANVVENYDSSTGYDEGSLVGTGGSGWDVLTRIGWYGSIPYKGAVSYFAPGLSIPQTVDMLIDEGQSILKAHSYSAPLATVSFALPSVAGTRTVQQKTGWPSGNKPVQLQFEAASPLAAYGHRFIGVATSDLINSPDWLTVRTGVQATYGAIT